MASRYSRIFQRVVRAFVLAWMIIAAGDSAFASEMRRGTPVRPSDHGSEVAACVQCSTDAVSASDNAADIEKLLSELDPSSRQAAEAVRVLFAALRSPDTDAGLRERSSAMLARIGEPAHAAIPVLIEILERSAETKSSVSTSEELQIGADPCYWVMKSLGLFGSVAADAVPSVARFLRSPKASSKLRVLAADTLGQIRTSASIGILTAELMKPRRFSNYESIVLRQTIIDGLALAAPLSVGAIPALVRATEDSNADIRRKACDAIGALGSRAEGGMNSLLERLILDEDAAVKDAAANALAQVGQPAIDPLVNLLERGDAELQWRAAKALGQTGKVAKLVIPQLKDAFGHASIQVRIEAVDAVWKISRDASVVDSHLLNFLSDDDRQIRRRAARLLVELDPLLGETSAALQKLASSGSTNGRGAAAYVIRERSRKAGQ
jgi:HEAT repeat protein